MRELFLPVTKDIRHSYNKDDEGNHLIQFPSTRTDVWKAVREPITGGGQPLSRPEEKEAQAIALLFLSDLEQLVSLLRLRSYQNPLADDTLVSVPLEGLEDGVAIMRSLLFDKKQQDNPKRTTLLRKLLEE